MCPRRLARARPCKRFSGQAFATAVIGGRTSTERECNQNDGDRFEHVEPVCRDGITTFRHRSALFMVNNSLAAILTSLTRNAALRLLQCVCCLEFAMKDVVEGILTAYQSVRPLDPESVDHSRRKISRYLESLASAGQRDAKQLTIYGLAYLAELNEGRDPRFTGC